MKTTTDKLTFALAVVLSLCVVCAGGYLCYMNSDDAWRYLLAIAIICAGWGFRHVLGGHGKTDAALTDGRRKVTQSLVLAGLILSLALIARLGWIDGLGDFGARSRLMRSSLPRQL